jgi:hypothetical protein
MVTQGDVLQFIAARVAARRATGFEGVVESFGLSPEAACDHLKRLWRDRLIVATEPRPPRFHYRLVPGERLQDLRFRMASRGRERLRWYGRQANRDTAWLGFR